MIAAARPLRRLLVLCLAVFSTTTAFAHEPGVTRVDVTVSSDGEVTAVVPADPAVVWRAARLAAGHIPGDTPPEAALTAQAASLADHVSRSVTMTADGQLTPLAVALHEWTVDRPGVSAASRRLVVTLRGRLPDGTRTLTWAYQLPVAAYPVRLWQPGRAEPRAVWVTGDRTSVPLTLEDTGGLATARLYVWLGIVHIVPRGLDHILFVLGLFLLSPSWRTLLAQVSAFTLAHTCALAAMTVGWISAPPSVVEPLIAASIAWVALENIWRSSLVPARLVVVYAFGVLHGAGFAGVLGDLGLPDTARLLALLAFNVGVELGQLAVIATAFAATAVLRHDARAYRRGVVVPASAIIAVIGAYLTIARLVGA